MRVRHCIFIILLTLAVRISLPAQVLPSPFVEDKTLPRWVKREFVSSHLYRNYSITFQMSPSSIRGDFNGDGRKDYAFLVQEKTTTKFGFVIFHGRASQSLHTHITLIAAGKTIAELGDNIHWANFWRTYPRDAAAGEEESKVIVPILKADAIHIEQKGKRRGLLYWDGRKYMWHKLKI